MLTYLICPSVQYIYIYIYVALKNGPCKKASFLCKKAAFLQIEGL